MSMGRRQLFTGRQAWRCRAWVESAPPLSESSKPAANHHAGTAAAVQNNAAPTATTTQRVAYLISHGSNRVQLPFRLEQACRKKVESFRPRPRSQQDSSRSQLNPQLRGLTFNHAAASNTAARSASLLEMLALPPFSIVRYGG
jgi:hypothetical protein